MFIVNFLTLTLKNLMLFIISIKQLLFLYKQHKKLKANKNYMHGKK